MPLNRSKVKLPLKIIIKYYNVFLKYQGRFLHGSTKTALILTMFHKDIRT